MGGKDFSSYELGKWLCLHCNSFIPTEGKKKIFSFFFLSEDHIIHMFHLPSYIHWGPIALV